MEKGSFEKFCAELREHIYRELGFGGPQKWRKEFPYDCSVTTGDWREDNQEQQVPEPEQDPVPAEFPILIKKEWEQSRKEEVEEYGERCDEGCSEGCGEEGDRDGNEDGDEDGGFYSSWV